VSEGVATVHAGAFGDQCLRHDIHPHVGPEYHLVIIDGWYGEPVQLDCDVVMAMGAIWLEDTESAEWTRLGPPPLTFDDIFVHLDVLVTPEVRTRRYQWTVVMSWENRRTYLEGLKANLRYAVMEHGILGAEFRGVMVNGLRACASDEVRLMLWDDYLRELGKRRGHLARR
jgi:hypothetical protein